MRAFLLVFAAFALGCGSVAPDGAGGDATIDSATTDGARGDGSDAADAHDASFADADGDGSAHDAGADGDADGAADIVDTAPDGFDATPGDGCTADEAVYGAEWCRDLLPTDGGYAPIVVDHAGNTIVAEKENVVEFDDAGAIVWSYAAPTPAPQAAVDATGFSTMAPMATVPVPSVPFRVERRAPDSTVVWSSTFGDSNTRGVSISTDAAGRTIVLGTFSGTVDFGGGPMTTTGPGTASNGFIVAFEADGRVRWQRMLGGELLEGVIRNTKSGDVVMEASFDSTTDVGGPSPIVPSKGGDRIYARWTDTGTLVWAKDYPSDANGPWLSTMVIDSDDSTVTMFSPMTPPSHMWMLRRIDADGKEVWTHFPFVNPDPGVGGVYVCSLTVDSASRLHLFGGWTFTGESVDFGCGATGGSNGLVFDLDADAGCLAQTKGTLRLPEFLGAGVAPDDSLRVTHGFDARLMKLPPRP